MTPGLFLRGFGFAGELAGDSRGEQVYQAGQSIDLIALGLISGGTAIPPAAALAPLETAIKDKVVDEVRDVGRRIAKGLFP